MYNVQYASKKTLHFRSVLRVVRFNERKTNGLKTGSRTVEKRDSHLIKTGDSRFLVTMRRGCVQALAILAVRGIRTAQSSAERELMPSVRQLCCSSFAVVSSSSSIAASIIAFTTGVRFVGLPLPACLAIPASLNLAKNAWTPCRLVTTPSFSKSLER